MQIKYLRFHKLLSNFAQELVGAFIPLILYKETHNITLAISYYIILRALIIMFDFIFKKVYLKSPQLIMLLRIIPMLLYYIFILFIEKNVWVAVCGILLFNSLSESFKNIPTDAVFNYNSLNSGSNTLGFIKVLERLGIVGAQLLGALFLDNLSTEILIVVSITIYLISTLPLFISYFKFRGNKSFNVDGISNAQQQFGKLESKMQKSKVITKKIFFLYGLSFMLFCVADLNTSVFGLFLYVKVDKYYIVGILSLLYYAIQIPFNYLTGKVDEKMDLLPFVVVGSIATGALTAAIGFMMIAKDFSLVMIIISLVFFLLMGAMYPFITIFYFDRMLLKSRILGKSNEMVVLRDVTALSAQIISVIPALGGSFVIAFIVMGVGFIIGGATLPYIEEKTRSLLVNYLQNQD